MLRRTVRGDTSHAMVAGIRDEKDAIRVSGEAVGRVEGGLGAGTVRVAGSSAAGQHSNVTLWRDLRKRMAAHTASGAKVSCERSSEDRTERKVPATLAARRCVASDVWDGVWDDVWEDVCPRWCESVRRVRVIRGDVYGHF